MVIVWQEVERGNILYELTLIGGFSSHHFPRILNI